MSSFSTNVSRVPALPVPRTISNVVANLRSHRINTRTRYGRRPQWKLTENQAFIFTLLKGDTLIDPISIGRHTTPDGHIVEPAVNGNNRLRSLEGFVSNRFGVPAVAEDGRTYTYYYSEIPPMEAREARRQRPRVLTPAQRNAFDDFPILFNCRPDLTETQEIAWYRELNRGLKAHTSGHLLVADICDPPTPAERQFADALLAHFPGVKDRINEDLRPEDANSLGAFLTETSRCEANFMDENDRRESVLLSHAIILNLLVNAHAYDDGWKGVFDTEGLVENAAAMRRIFETATLSDDMRGEFAALVKNKPSLQNFYHPSYLLGPMAWSLATHKPDAEATWMRFLSNARPGTIAEVYGNDLAGLKYDDSNANKYRFAWDRVCEYVPPV